MARKGNIVWHAYRRKENALASEDALEPVAREKHLALREDGKIIEKLIVEHWSLFDNGKVNRHDYGWKLAGKPKADVLTIQGARSALEPLGFVFVP